MARGAMNAELQRIVHGFKTNGAPKFRQNQWMNFADISREGLRMAGRRAESQSHIELRPTAGV
ncbi:hypothetical protein B5V03_12655 [Bradyrhizobium betae]|uniref:Uncharacterized protein n=1 Tax=Bradyrhizobium betae TaxID=244734 RepID=A0A4V1P6T7_9BRAD|nr:hypothetical protein B5V03_12655 [Bradyrhizobium betae]